MKRTILITSAILILLFVFSVGCEDTPKSVPQSPSQNGVATRADPLSSATMAKVITMSKNWDADAEDDGVAVFPGLQDNSEATVKFTGVTLQVDIEIYTERDPDTHDKPVKGDLIYSGTGTITSWKDGNPFMSTGIRVPFEQISAPPGEKFGIVHVKIHTPGGKVYEAETSAVLLHPQ